MIDITYSFCQCNENILCFLFLPTQLHILTFTETFQVNEQLNYS